MNGSTSNGSNGGSGGGPGENPNIKYRFYSSKAEHGLTFNSTTVEKDSNIDKFVASLEDKCIVLETTPAPVAKLDCTDGFSKWLVKAGIDADVSLLVGSTEMQILSFEVAFRRPWKVTFSSSAGALKSSFGDAAANIPLPGAHPETGWLYCGLDIAKTEKISRTVQDLYTEAGSPGMIPFVPDSILGLAVTFDPANADTAHNALWFKPSAHNQTIIRLQFQLDAWVGFQDMLGCLNPSDNGFKIKSIDVVCKRSMIEAQLHVGTAASCQGRVIFTMNGSINNKVDVVSTAEFRETTLTLTLVFKKSQNTLKDILDWLGSLINDRLDMVKDLPQTDGTFSGLNLRKVTIVLKTAKNKRPIVSGFYINVEVSAGFGLGGSGVSQKPVIFLLSYNWTRGIGRLGYIRGQLWNTYESAGLKEISPYYDWTDLQPTTAPAPSINLVSLIPGQKIENIPSNIPTDITHAYVFLYESHIVIGGTITCLKISPRGSAPQPYLGEVRLAASYAWGKNSAFTLRLSFKAGLQPGIGAKHQDVATLTGSMNYDSSQKSWGLKAELQGLYASTLYEFFDKSSSQHVMPLIDSIEIHKLAVNYQYSSEGAADGKSVGKNFTLTGSLFIGGLDLELTFNHDPWEFKASLRPREQYATLGWIITSVLGDGRVDIPDFLSNIDLTEKDGFEIAINKVKSQNSENSSFHFHAKVTLGGVGLTFIQYHDGEWDAKVPSKRLVRITLQGLDIPEIPLVGRMDQPFHGLTYMWVQDPVTPTDKPPGLTRKEIRDLNISLKNDSLVFKDRFKERKDSDVLITAGSHFMVLMQSSGGQKICVLDYDFRPKPASTEASIDSQSTQSGNPAQREVEEEGEEEAAAQAPFKKRSGPLSLKNIGLKYSSKQLHISFDAMLELGPLEFSLIGLGISLEITRLNEVPKVLTPKLQGMAVAFDKNPLAIAGLFQHKTEGNLEYYSGGLIMKFDPYQFRAAGFYGQASPPNQDPFTSFFMFLKVDGPLIHLGYAEISGLTGGFGYKSEIRTPAPHEITSFPFIAQTHSAGSMVRTLEYLTNPGNGGFIYPKNDTYWAAGGVKVDAFQMLSMDAVVVLQFGKSIKLGIVAVVLADIPSSKAWLKFAHVELGLAVVVDLDYGTLRAEGQLSPNSYILHPDCHLTGGFALYYWFDAPHADNTQIDNFVFTIGGYHQAFVIPSGYPNPPRLTISWSLGKNLSITGQAYFAMTPKICMGGGHLNASFSAGPVRAWFDVFIDFLINYEPFHFAAIVAISVGIRSSIGCGILETCVSAEVGAQLTLWGPPLAGRVHVDCWVTSFDINFGESWSKAEAVKLMEFYHLVIQAGSRNKKTAAVAEAHGSAVQKAPINEAHVFVAQSGLMNAGNEAGNNPNAPWMVRGGALSVLISCKMAINSATQGTKTISHDEEIYAKPMHLTGPMSSTMAITVAQGGVASDAQWKMKKQMKSVPRALWGVYDRDKDPSNGNNNVTELLHSKDSTVSLMMGVLITAPPPLMSPDRLPVFNTATNDMVTLKSIKSFPGTAPSHEEWEPAEPLEGDKQWDAVHKAWKNPVLGTGSGGQAGFVAKWAEVFNWDVASMSRLAALPERMDKRFNGLFASAPLITK